MNNKWLIASVSCLVIGCSPKVSVQTPSEPTPQPATAVATPSATPLSTPAPTPTMSHLAPAGVYFLLQKITVETADGIAGLPPGTRATVLKDFGDTLRLSSRGHEFNASRSQVTNDLDVAAAVARNDASAQQAVGRNFQQQKMANELTEQERLRQTKTVLPTQVPPPVQPRINPLSEPAKRVNPDQYDQYGRKLPHSGKIY